MCARRLLTIVPVSLWGGCSWGGCSWGGCSWGGCSWGLRVFFPFLSNDECLGDDKLQVSHEIIAISMLKSLVNDALQLLPLGLVHFRTFAVSVLDVYGL